MCLLWPRLASYEKLESYLLGCGGGVYLVCGIGADKYVYICRWLLVWSIMEGKNATTGEDCAREMILYIYWGGFFKEGVGGSYVTMRGGKTVGEGDC